VADPTRAPGAAASDGAGVATGARKLMLSYLDKIAEHFGYVRVGTGDELQQARAMLAGDRGEEVLHELSLAYLRRRDEFAGVESVHDLQRRFDRLLVRAAAKVARDDETARALAEDPDQPAEDEDEFARGALRAATDHWRKT
jgi:hypothetical protein